MIDNKRASKFSSCRPNLRRSEKNDRHFFQMVNVDHRNYDIVSFILYNIGWRPE